MAILHFIWQTLYRMRIMLPIAKAVARIAIVLNIFKCLNCLAVGTFLVKIH